jgi:hypothetical protein
MTRRLANEIRQVDGASGRQRDSSVASRTIDRSPRTSLRRIATVFTFLGARVRRNAVLGMDEAPVAGQNGLMNPINC